MDKIEVNAQMVDKSTIDSKDISEPEPEPEPSIKLVDDIEYKFIVGDCIEELKNLPDKTISLVVTSPPYNIGLKYHKYEDKKPREQYLEWIYDIFTELKRVLKDEGHIFLNMGYTNKDPWISMEVALKLKDILVLQNKITWVKSISVPDELPDPFINHLKSLNKSNKSDIINIKSLESIFNDYVNTNNKDILNKKNPTVTHGQYKPINSNRYINVTNEDIYHFTKTDKIECDRNGVGVPYKWKCNLIHRKTKIIKPDIRCKGNSWFIPYDTINSKKERGYHPAIFPEGLAEHCIRVSGIKKGVVLDPFIGSGTTVRVAKKLSENKEYELSGKGIDMDEQYIKYCNETI